MFKNWCATQGFNNASKLSHVLMDGGKLSVPFDRLNEFYEKYVEAIKSGEELYVVEQKTETYNFFVDIDYKSPEALGIDDIKDISKVICDTVRGYGGKECIISVAMPRECGHLVKTGVHFNWSNFVVDQDTAITLRELILVDLVKFRPGVHWDDIVDSSVYGDARRRTKGSGFRMPWSHKMQKCPACDGKGCDKCTKGKISHGPYLPVFKYTKSPLVALIRIDQQPTIETLKMATIRTDAPQNVVIDGKKEGSFTQEQTKDEIHDEMLKNSIETFVRKHMEGQSDAYLTKIFKHKTMYLVSTNSRYCENLKRKHNSNHIWFIISGRHILQKCFCDCPTLKGRRDGFCKDFCGRRHQLPTDIYDKLYPEKEKCPEIKKRQDKPTVNFRPQLETFIGKFMKVDDNVSIINTTSKNGTMTVLTTSKYCETIGGYHDDKLMSYVIKKNHIKQKCPICTRSKARTHVLSPNVLKLLKQ